MVERVSLEWLNRPAPRWVRALPWSQPLIAACGCPKHWTIAYVPEADAALHVNEYPPTICPEPFVTKELAEEVGAQGSRFATEWFPLPCGATLPPRGDAGWECTGRDLVVIFRATVTTPKGPVELPIVVPARALECLEHEDWWLDPVEPFTGGDHMHMFCPRAPGEQMTRYYRTADPEEEP